MFRIVRSSEPLQLKETNKLFNEEIQDLNIEKAYNHYKDNKNRFKYNTPETKKLFKEMNYERCSFCTKHLTEFDDEMTVEHIKTKKRYPQKIYEWENLLCSCNVCNNKRSTNIYDDSRYLDPTKIIDIENYFKYNLDGEIVPNNILNQTEFDKADYMIKLYKLNRKGLVCSRRKFLKELIEDDKYYEILKEHDYFSDSIIFLSLFAYYKKEKK